MIRHARGAGTPLPRVVVLGASGFIGSHLVEHLAEAGASVVAVSSSKVDLAHPSAVEALHAVVAEDDAVVFASCITRERGEDAAIFMRNLAMAEHVGAFLERGRCAHVVYLGSDSVYAESAGPIREDSPCDPAGLYGLAHLVRERLLRHAAERADVPLLVLRLCAVYGVGDTHNSYGPNRFLRTAAGAREIVLFGEGEEHRDHLYVDDVCRLVAVALARRTTGLVNVATGVARSFAEVAQMVRRVAGRPVEVRSAARQVAVTHRRFDVAALQTAFPEVWLTPLDKGLAMMGGPDGALAKREGQ
jgi:nucleoside-diphosphate-sugar epimerase